MPMISSEASIRLTLSRFFTEWFYAILHVRYHITMGLSYNFFFMWIFALNGVAWVLYTWLSGEWRLIVPERRVIEMMGATITQLHGAPLRLYTPTKYGYKQIRRIGVIAYTNEKPDDYWTKLG